MECFAVEMFYIVVSYRPFSSLLAHAKFGKLNGHLNNMSRRSGFHQANEKLGYPCWEKQIAKAKAQEDVLCIDARRHILGMTNSTFYRLF